MQKIIMLGTGHGFVFECYNTCFLLQNDDKYLLVDTGGGVQIVKNLSIKGISLLQIHDIFISHCHTDHLLGLFWILKRMSGLMQKGEYIGNLNIYCNDEVANAINNIFPHIFPNKKVEIIKEKMKIHILEANSMREVSGRKMTFFDVKASKNKLYGFEMTLDSQEKLIFLGDETCKPDLYERIKNADYVMHEAFCLDKEEEIFHPYEKHHSTVKSVCQKMNPLNIKNLILFHTEDTHLQERKKLYTEEGKEYFSGNILIPDDLEEIEID